MIGRIDRWLMARLAPPRQTAEEALGRRRQAIRQRDIAATRRQASEAVDKLRAELRLLEMGDHGA